MAPTHVTRLLFCPLSIMSREKIRSLPRPVSSRVATANDQSQRAISSHGPRILVAVNESRGLETQIGLAVFDRSTSRCAMYQVFSTAFDSQSRMLIVNVCVVCRYKGIHQNSEQIECGGSDRGEHRFH